MHRIFKHLIVNAGHACGYFSLRRYLSRHQLCIATYHGVDAYYDPVVNFDRLQTDPELFKKQLETFARAFRIVDLREAVEHFRQKGRWPERSLSITFDDGYLNNLEVAAPILKRMGIPATFFVTSGYCEGTLAPWWYILRQHLAAKNDLQIRDKTQRCAELEAMLRPLASAERQHRLSELGVQMDISTNLPYPFMNPDQCRQLLALGFDVQCHGSAHLSFQGESDDVLASDLKQSVDFIRSLGHTPWAFAYPYGHKPKTHGPARNMMSSIGISVALAMGERTNRREADLYALARFDLHGGYSPAGALAKVSA